MSHVYVQSSPSLASSQLRKKKQVDAKTDTDTIRFNEASKSLKDAGASSAKHVPRPRAFTSGTNLMLILLNISNILARLSDGSF